MYKKGKESIVNDNIVSADVNVANAPQKTESYIAKRFSISFVWTLAIFILMIIGTQPQNQWVAGHIGSAMFALFSGVVAIAIQTKRKFIFVPVSLLISLVLVAIIGVLIST